MTKFERVAKALGATLLPAWEDGTLVFDFGWCWISLMPLGQKMSYAEILDELRTQLTYAAELGGPLDGH